MPDVDKLMLEADILEQASGVKATRHYTNVCKGGCSEGHKPFVCAKWAIQA